MRYELDANGYVIAVFWGCHSGNCAEYTGTVPYGYTDLHDWSENANINAYYLEDGNLVYDAYKDYKLTLQYDEDAKNYKNVTYKELGITTSEQEKAYNDLFPSLSSASGEIVTVDSYVGNLPTDEVTIKGDNITSLIELEFIGSNFLPNTAVSSSNNGIDYNVVKEKKIDVSGTATAKSTLNLAGTDTNIKKILTFKRNTDYFLSGINENVNLELYYYDGAERTLVGTYNGGLINFDIDMPVTQIVLTIDSGVTIDATIEPMLSLGNTETTYEEYKNNSILIDLKNESLTSKDVLELKDNNTFLRKPEKEIILGNVVIPRTYEPITHAYSHQQVTLSFVYKDPRNIDITKISLKGLVQTMEIESTYNFTNDDLNNAMSYMAGGLELTDEQFELYDINADGCIDTLDLAIMMKMINGTISNTIKGTLEINTTKSQRTIVLRDEENTIKTSIGLEGMTTPSLSCDKLNLGDVSLNNALTYSENEEVVGTFLGKPIYRKTLIIDSIGNNVNLSIPLTVDDIDKIWINESCSFIISNTESLGVNWFYTTSDYMRTSIIKSTKVLRIKSPSSLSGFAGYITIEYTKTTD